MKKLYSSISMAALALIISSGAKAEITSIDQLFGTYNAVYTWGFYDNNGNPDGAPDFLINPEITAGTAENEILINGLFPTNGNDFPQNANNPISGFVNLTNRTISISANQTLGTDNYGTNTLYIGEYNLDTDQIQQVNSVTAYILDNGDIEFPTQYVIGCASTANGGGLWYVFYTLTLQPYGGEYAHDAKFYSGTYSAKFNWYSEDGYGNELTPPNMEINPTIVPNPQKVYNLSIADLYPFYNANINIEGEVTPAGSIKIDNVQLFDFSGTAYQLIIFDNQYMMPDYVLAHLDDKGNLLFPEGVTLGMGYYVGPRYEFQSLYGYTNLTLDKDNAGIESIGEDIDAPVKYFNLNGQQVKNPAPGQILIKKQGKSISKILTR